MIADVRRIMAGAAEPGNALLVEHIIQPSDTGDVDFHGIEQLLAPRDRLVRAGNDAVPAQPVPCIEQFEYFWGERCSGRVASERIVDPDEKLFQLPGERYRAALYIGVKE